LRHVVFSDIHGNLEALEAVVQHAGAARADFFLCLGDVVGYGADPNACIDALRALPRWACLRGNHDAAVIDPGERTFFHEVALEGIQFTASRLTEENKRFLAALPYTYTDHATYMGVHASPSRPEAWDYVLDHAGAARAFAAMGAHRIAFIGHSHAPVIFGDDGRVQRFPADAAVALELDRARYVINVGSVGQPRDGNPDAAYVLYDDAVDTVRLLRVPYDRERAAEKILRAGLPAVLAERLLVGY
jgi:diadenosine tetraphosphatase ApaH/serine/threonine PP2A family protein phosphatase